MPISQTASARRNAQTSYPLVALFLLVSIAASLAAQMALLRSADLPSHELRREAIVFAIVGAILGTMIGLCHFRRVQGGFLGFGIGIFVGATGGLIAKIGDTDPLQAMAASAGCGVTLLLFTSIYRASNRRHLRASFFDESQIT